MKLLLVLILNLIFLFSFAQTNPNHVYVNGYYRSNGTFVEGHYRTAPNSTVNDNFSTVGHVNPYTGQAGYVSRDNYSQGLQPQIIEPPKNAPYFDAAAIANKLYPVKPVTDVNPIRTQKTLIQQTNYIRGGKYFKNSAGKRNYIVQTL